ncbi:MAG TPA: hypothetical protein VG013_43410 [Gemmataceae bacterium]|jgi:hypothetical protein|nr:hypothetical protein [Gemmataceae bacterium]
MKRIILEWGVILAVGSALALSTLWVVSRFFDRSSYHLRITTSKSVADDLHLLVGEGDLALCDQFDVDTSGTVRPLIVNHRDVVASNIPGGDRFGQFTIPGLDLRYCRIAPTDYLIWSLRVTMLFPIVLSLLGAALFRYRLKRRRACIRQRAD